MHVRSIRSLSSNATPLLVLVLCVLATPNLLVSQIGGSFSESGLSEPLTGVVRNEGGGSIAGYRVELSNSGGWEKTSTEVRPDGSFRIPVYGSSGKQYLLRVVDGRGQVVHDDIVRPDMMPLEIHLSGSSKERPVSGVVSLEELRHPVPKKAMREYQRALKASDKGDLARAVQHLSKAIKIHPEFTEAHNSLGVKYMMLGDYARAAAAFEEALRLKPDAPQPLSNLGVAYHGLQRFDEAEEAIRASLKLRPGVTKTRFSLALVLLVKEGADREEAVDILLDVVAEVPQAHLCLATYLEGKADYASAAREVAAYLATEDQQYRAVAVEWLGRLRSAEPRRESAAIH